MTTVTWVQDSNGNFEVSSAEHLKQIMHEGGLYSDAGTPPSGYWDSGTSYVQTVDIDLLSDSTDIKPIGLFPATIFNADYDGGGYQISNWSYVDPELSTSQDCETQVGLFGSVGAATIKNMRLTGTWSLQGFKEDAGFLVGKVSNSSTTDIAGIFNIDCDFSAGTLMDKGTSFITPVYGGVIGDCTVPILEGVVVKGSIDFGAQAGDLVGGVVGNLSVKIRASFIENTATFPSGIQGDESGGIAGKCLTATGVTISNWINAMTGDIVGEKSAGGVIGEAFIYNDTTLVEATVDNLVNSMTGNVTHTGFGTSGEGAGGIFGNISGIGTITRCINYMTGNVSSVNDKFAGGLVGYLLDSFGVASSFTNSICAMNGSVKEAIIGFLSGSNTIVGSLSRNTNFGFTFTNTDGYGTTASPSGMLTLVEFPDLPYVSLDGTGEFSIVYSIDFVYANIAGNVSYSTTHLIVKDGNSTFQNGAVLVIISPLSITTRPVNMLVTFAEVTGATGYNITYEGPTGGEITAVSGTTTLEHNITGLDPETSYIIRLYADTGAGYVLTEELTEITLPNVGTNYDMTDFQNSSGVTDLTSVDDGTLENISEVINDLFNTGEPVLVSVQGNAELNTFFIKLGEALSIGALSALLLPFVQSAGAGQSVIVTLSDGTTDVTINYDHTLNSLEVNGDVYYPGDSFVLDGQKVSVAEY